MPLSVQLFPNHSAIIFFTGTTILLRLYTTSHSVACRHGVSSICPPIRPSTSQWVINIATNDLNPYSERDGLFFRVISALGHIYSSAAFRERAYQLPSHGATVICSSSNLNINSLYWKKLARCISPTHPVVFIDGLNCRHDTLVHVNFTHAKVYVMHALPTPSARILTLHMPKCMWCMHYPHLLRVS